MGHFVNRNCPKSDLSEALVQNLVFGATAENNFVTIKQLEITVLGFAPKTYLQAPKITVHLQKSRWFIKLGAGARRFPRRRPKIALASPYTMISKFSSIFQPFS